MPNMPYKIKKGLSRGRKPRKISKVLDFTGQHAVMLVEKPQTPRGAGKSIRCVNGKEDQQLITTLEKSVNMVDGLTQELVGNNGLRNKAQTIIGNEVLALMSTEQLNEYAKFIEFKLLTVNYNR
ncbi:168_t:CDS:2 [Paraglomus brasilianum]|uniref:168_t:CDS:1 n=1 Tax=Paraglomus brasilianum TaxID=144538 RepID=A0A9N9F1Q6_9GLOM|nr:168_t:CDS:2 [Paraglomus brasilianum]